MLNVINYTNPSLCNTTLYVAEEVKEEVNFYIFLIYILGFQSRSDNRFFPPKLTKIWIGMAPCERKYGGFRVKLFLSCSKGFNEKLCKWWKKLQIAKLEIDIAMKMENISIRRFSFTLILLLAASRVMITIFITIITINILKIIIGLY